MEPVGEQVRDQGHGGHDPPPAAFRVVVLLEGDQLPDITEPGEPGRMRLAAVAGQRGATVEQQAATAATAADADAATVRTSAVAEAAAHARVVTQQVRQAPGTEQPGAAAAAHAPASAADATAADAQHHSTVKHGGPQAHDVMIEQNSLSLRFVRLLDCRFPLVLTGCHNSIPTMSSSLKNTILRRNCDRVEQKIT